MSSDPAAIVFAKACVGNGKFLPASWHFLDRGWFWDCATDSIYPTPPAALRVVEHRNNSPEAIELIDDSQAIACAFGLTDTQVTEFLSLLPQAQDAKFLSSIKKSEMSEVINFLRRGRLTGARFFAPGTTDTVLDWIGARASKGVRLALWDNIHECT